MSINIFVQSENATAVTHLTFPTDTTISTLKATLIERGLATAESEVFLEDSDDALDPSKTVGAVGGGKNVKLHVHKCKQVQVTVTFSGRAQTRKFPPSTTIAKVHRWATEAFNLSPDDAADHVLQLSGTHERPSVATHIGTLARDCRAAFDLVPNERIQG